MIKDFKNVDLLSYSDFEIFVCDVFTDAGWKDAVITKVGKEYTHGDGGVDIFAYKNKRKFAIEVKQRKIGSNVDVSALNQLVTGAKLANVKNMILVTNSYFTSEVRVRALKLGVELVDRDSLQNLWLEKHSEIGREIKLRKYQESVIQEALKTIEEGKTKLLIEMATGLGKTYTIANLVKNLLNKNHQYKKILFLAHQVEILLQSVTAFKNILGIGTYSFSACFDGSNPEDTDFVFGSFDTFYSKLSTLDSDLFDIVIIDEAHHVPARTYSQVVEHLEPKLLFGLTATPYREDLKSVLNYFGGADGHIGKYDLVWALRHNKVAFPKYNVLLDDLANHEMDMLKQGMSVSDIDKSLFLHKKDEEIVRLIEKATKEQELKDPKGIVFCKSIEHMKYLIQFFPAGKATLVHSKMKDAQRRENIRSFREGDFNYILVCDLFNEGIDIPETNLLVFIRYTGSRTVWLQQLGRGLRKTRSKEFVVVLDFVGSLERLNEVKNLVSAVKKMPIDPSNYEPRNLKAKGSKDIRHDDHIKIEYNSAAAQVLELLSTLSYRLNFRFQAIDSLRTYYEDNHLIPDFEVIDSELSNITRDQINTLFNSYLGYIQAAFELSLFDSRLSKISKKCLEYINTYEANFGVKPSCKAVSQNSIYEFLPYYTEKEVQSILSHFESTKTISDDVFTPNSHIIDHSKTKSSNSGFQNETNCGISGNNVTQGSAIESDKDRLIKKYSHLEKPQDIKALPQEVRDEIRGVFKSELAFLRQVKKDMG